MKAGIKNKFVNSENCYEIIKRLERNSNDSNQLRNNILEYFKNKSVLANYGSYRVYQIYDVSFDQRPENTFINYKDENGNLQEISLYNYYQKQYRITVRKDQFLFIYKNKRDDSEIHLIPELFSMTGMDEENRNNERLKMEMLNKSRLKAEDRARTTLGIKNMFLNEERPKKNKKTPKQICNEWGFEPRDLADFEGTTLNPPVISYSEGMKSNVSRGKFNHQKVYKMPMSFQEFDENSFLVFCSRNDRNNALKFLSNLESSSGRIGIINRNLNKSRIVQINNDNEREWIEIVKDEIYNEKKNSKVQKTFLFIVNNYNKRFYNSLKKVLREKGILSQFIQGTSVNKPLTVSSNIFLQILAKSGGLIYKIDFHNKLQESPCAIVGIETNSTAVSVVLSNNRDFSEYYSEFRILKNESNVSKEVQVADCIVECLNILISKFQIKCKDKELNKLFIYRAGTNEFGNKKIIDIEIPRIENLLEKYKNLRYNIALVVTKQDLKLFTDSYNGYNYPGEGIVIDKGLTKPNEFEFYLLPTNGTGTPTYFKVVKVHGLEKMPKDIYYEMTNNLCYYFWNWSGAIKVPACLKFAEKQLTFIDQNSNDTGEYLKDKPHFI